MPNVSTATLKIISLRKGVTLARSPTGPTVGSQLVGVAAEVVDKEVEGNAVAEGGGIAKVALSTTMQKARKKKKKESMRKKKKKNGLKKS